MQISLFPQKKSSFGTNLYLMRQLVGFNDSCAIANGWKTRQLKQASMPVRFSHAKLLVHPAAVSWLSNVLCLCAKASICFPTATPTHPQLCDQQFQDELNGTKQKLSSTDTSILATVSWLINMSQPFKEGFCLHLVANVRDTSVGGSLLTTLAARSSTFANFQIMLPRLLCPNLAWKLWPTTKPPISSLSIPTIEFLHHLHSTLKQQKLTFSGVGAHHQNRSCQMQHKDYLSMGLHQHVAHLALLA
jgi:hypothetical protein